MKKFSKNMISSQKPWNSRKEKKISNFWNFMDHRRYSHGQKPVVWKCPKKIFPFLVVDQIDKKFKDDQVQNVLHFSRSEKEI